MIYAYLIGGGFGIMVLGLIYAAWRERKAGADSEKVKEAKVDNKAIIEAQKVFNDKAKADDEKFDKLSDRLFVTELPSGIQKTIIPLDLSHARLWEKNKNSLN